MGWLVLNPPEREPHRCRLPEIQRRVRTRSAAPLSPRVRALVGIGSRWQCDVCGVRWQVVPDEFFITPPASATGYGVWVRHDPDAPWNRRKGFRVRG